jgi:hypothetical protein
LSFDPAYCMVRVSFATRAENPMSDYDRIASFTLADFAPYVGTMFPVAWGERTIGLTLVLAAALPSPRDTPAPAALRAEPFQLQFEEAAHWSLPQQIHGFDHAALGSFPLFIVPIGPNPEKTGFLYQAAFT